MRRTVCLCAVAVFVAIGALGSAGAQRRFTTFQDSGTAAIAGRITTPAGGPAGSGLHVALSNATQPVANILSDQNGEFRFEALKAADYTVSVFDDSGRFDPVNQAVRILPGTRAVVTIYL